MRLSPGGVSEHILAKRSPWDPQDACLCLGRLQPQPPALSPAEIGRGVSQHAPSLVCRYPAQHGKSRGTGWKSQGLRCSILGSLIILMMLS